MKTITTILIIIVFFSCSEKNKKNNCNFLDSYTISIDNSKFVKLSYIDSILSEKIYNLRIDAINIESSNLILKKYANDKNITLEELKEKEIVNKIKKINKNEILLFVRNNINTTEDDAKRYLLYQRKMDRQIQFVDSLKKEYNFKIKLIPSFFNSINTDSLLYFDITNNKNSKKIYIISDFNCYSCKKTKKSVEKIIYKYNKKIDFKFVYLSEYINPIILNTIYNANMNNNFKNILDLLFENQAIINTKSKLDSIIEKNNFSSYLSINKSNEILSKAINTREFLIKNNVYSTPSFIINNKIVDSKYALDYLEEIIIKEYKINEN